MLKVGLTGGIGAGKSEVARLLAAHGALVVDADRLAREVVEPGTPGLSAVVEEFGAELLGPDGALDRGRLGRLVFADAQARRRLESIVHPLVAERSAALMAAAPPGAVVVYDVPLLVENDLTGDFDVVVVVDAPEDLQLRRLVEGRGMLEADARARLAAQARREQRLAVADHVIDNAGTLVDLKRQVAQLWEQLGRVRADGSDDPGT